MKKGLSILLVAAALFGFYGSAVSLNDVLACKDYWEKAGEESTANMNKLEDGLNQLKENEQAYLDGKDQVAEGEKALADGEAQYAQGLADYEAAPGKLAAGEKKLAAGEKKLADGYATYNKGQKDLADGKKEVAKGENDLAAGKKELAKGENDLAAGKKAVATGQQQLDSLNTLIGGIKQILAGYPTFKNGYKELRDGRTDKVLAKVPELAPTLEKVQKRLTEAGNTAALQKLGTASTILQTQAGNVGFTNKDYDEFNTALTALKDALNACTPILSAVDQEVLGIKDGEVQDGMTLQDIIDRLEMDDEALGTMIYTAQCKERGMSDEAIKAYIESLEEGQVTGAGQAAKKQIVSKVQEFVANSGEKLQTLVKNFDEKELTEVASISAKIAEGNPAEVANALKSLRSVLNNVHTSINTFQGMIDGYTNDKNGQLTRWINGYADITSNGAKAAQNALVKGVADIIGGVLISNNAELIGGMNAAAKQVGFTPTEFTPQETSKLAKDMASDSALENFYNDMNKIEAGFNAVLPALEKKAQDGAAELNAGKAAVAEGEKKLAAGKQALAEGEKKLAAGKAAVADGEKKLAAGKKDLAQGEKDLAAGKKELAQGYADYEAAPGKLADAEKQLADGRQALADGKEKLAQYEDGEQQVRDGLATLAATEADLDLKSILDRLGGDDDFDNGDGHLELDEGLAAVEVGRGYQAEDGVLITEEITARAVGTAALLGAGVLAVIAAILSFLKKNKGAGVFAILAAAAGAFGAFYGTNAGTYFSNIAGSTVGATGWIAAGILGAVALVHAIVHFAAPKNA